MSYFRTESAVAALLAAIVASPAAADVTAEQAWSTLRDMMTGSGYESAATESREGDALVVSDAVFTMTSEEAGASTAVDFGTLRFVENGDGTVTVEMPDTMPITSTFPDPELDGPVTIHMEMTQSGASMVMSGTPESMTQSYSASSLELALTSFDGPDDTLPPDAVKMSMMIQGLSSDSVIGQGDLRPIEVSSTADSLNFDMAFQVPGQGKGAASGEMTGLGFEGTGTLPTDSTAGGDLVALMEAGYALTGSFSHQGGGMTLSGEEEGNSFEAVTSSGSATFDMDASDESLAYTLSQSDSTISVTTSTLPFPLEVQAETIQAGFDMPLAESEEAKDFALLVNLQDFVMSDMIWMMFDPEGVLPRDPASLLVDLTGKARLFVNLLDPEATEELTATGAAPGELQALEIKSLKLNLVGAELTGVGDFTFDNTDTLGGMPKPVGQVDLSLAGGNALLDKLMQLGLIGEQEAGSARMMMGLLAVPGQEPDTLNSKLEINAEGHIMANGQRIQ